MQPERSAEEIDARGDDRRTNAVVVEHQRLDEVVEMALVIRDVEHAPACGRFARMLDVLGDATNLSQEGIERVLKRAIKAVPLRRAELVEIRFHALPGVIVGPSAVRAEVPRHIIARQHCPRDVIGSHVTKTIAEQRPLRFPVHAFRFSVLIQFRRLRTRNQNPEPEP